MQRHIRWIGGKYGAGFGVPAIVLALLSTVGCTSYRYHEPPCEDYKPVEYVGDIEYSVRNDSLFIDYNLESVMGEPDSTLLVLGNDQEQLGPVAIFPFPTVLPNADSLESISDPDTSLPIKGKVAFPKHRKNLRDYFVRIISFRRQCGENFNFEDKHHLLPPLISINLTFPPALGYMRTSLPDHSHCQSLTAGFEVGLSINLTRSRFYISSAGDQNATFVFSDPARVEYRFYTGTRYNFLPAFHIALKYSRLGLGDENGRYFRDDFGVEGGISLEGKFERLSYSYSTTVGSHHAISLYLALNSGPVPRMGTEYALKKSEDAWVIRIGCLIEGLFPSPETSALKSSYDRPLVEKFFAFIGTVPMLIFMFLLTLGGPTVD